MAAPRSRRACVCGRPLRQIGRPHTSTRACVACMPAPRPGYSLLGFRVPRGRGEAKQPHPDTGRLPLAETFTPPAPGVRAARERGEACRLSPRRMRCRLVVRGSPGRSQEPVWSPGGPRRTLESPGQPRRAQEAQGSPREAQGSPGKPTGASQPCKAMLNPRHNKSPDSRVIL